MTSTTSYGGNLISKPDLGHGLHTFANDAYVYQHLALANGESSAITLPSCTLYVRSCTSGATLTVNGQAVTEGDSVQLENTPATLAMQGGHASILIAGVTHTAKDETSLTITRAGQHYKVSKPWGHELWFNGEHPAYVLKEVFLKAGNRTSLQYHDFKRETNVVFTGTAGLVYKSNDAVGNMDVSLADLGTIALPAGSVMDIYPPTLHRVVAETDIYLYETSTPHLDDVIRVHDDAGRGQGRIQSEHAASKVA